MFRPTPAALLSLFVLILAPLQPARADDAKSYDVVVYGGTSSGVIAAVKAARLGKSAVLIEPGKHLGGLTSGGLGATDIGNKGAIGGMSRDFYRALGKAYGQEEAWKFEPHVAEKIYDDWAAEAKVPVVKGERLDLKNGVKKDGPRIVSIAMESGKTFAGKVFIDATYEGDLMAKAGVDYRVGREARAEYGESLNGVCFGHGGHQFTKPVDPYVKPGDPKSGLLPGVHAGSPGEDGQGDKRVQAYNFRICMTDVKENQLPFPKPAGYDPMRYELLLRYLNGGVFDVFGNNQRMPNGKTDTNNNGAFSSDNIGMNYDYPEGDYATRDKIFQDHVTYHQGMLWFLANDPRVPAKAREFTKQWGLCKDEFQDTGGWGHQLYVREARRMRGAYTMVQQNCEGKDVAPTPSAWPPTGWTPTTPSVSLTRPATPRTRGTCRSTGSRRTRFPTGRSRRRRTNAATCWCRCVCRPPTSRTARSGWSRSSWCSARAPRRPPRWRSTRTCRCRRSTTPS